MKELDKVLSCLTREMRVMVEHLNDIVGKAVPVILRARMHSAAGVLSVCYKIRQNASTRTRLFETDPQTGRQACLVNLRAGDMEELKSLDCERQILNHRYRTAFAERKSLRLLHRNLRMQSGVIDET